MPQADTIKSSPNIENELHLLEALVLTPETTQADLSVRVGVAVGTVNWYLKRWSKKGYIKVQRIGRWNWRYLLTPEGIARKHQLAGAYVTTSFSLYRRIRAEAKGLLHQVVQSDLSQVALYGDSEIVDICRLTCLELQLDVVESVPDGGPELGLQRCVPTLHVEGLHLSLVWPSASQENES